MSFKGFVPAIVAVGLIALANGNVAEAGLFKGCGGGCASHSCGPSVVWGACAPSSCDWCDPCASSCGKKKCGLGLLAKLKKHCKRSCNSCDSCDVAADCGCAAPEPACGAAPCVAAAPACGAAAPSCGCEPAPSCGCEPASCCAPKKCGGLFAKLRDKLKSHSCGHGCGGCGGGCDVVEPACGCSSAPSCGCAPQAAPSCGCEPTCGC